MKKKVTVKAHEDWIGYAIVAAEWPEVKRRLQDRLERGWAAERPG